MTRIIESAEALDLLKQAVEKKGEDFIYPNEWREEYGGEDSPGSCVYFQGGQPRCIVGHALHFLGVRVLTEGDRAGALNQFVRGDVKFTERALHVLQRAQKRQDEFGTWGEALKDAQLAMATSGYQEVVSQRSVDPLMQHPLLT